MSMLNRISHNVTCIFFNKNLIPLPYIEETSKHYIHPCLPWQTYIVCHGQMTKRASILSKVYCASLIGSFSSSLLPYTTHITRLKILCVYKWVYLKKPWSIQNFIGANLEFLWIIKVIRRPHIILWLCWLLNPNILTSFEHVA